MKLPAKFVAGLLPLVLSGCWHKSNQAQVQQPLAPPIIDAPPAKPAAPVDLPPPVVTPPQGTEPAKAPSSETQAPPPRPRHRKPKPKDQSAPAQQPAANTQVASNGSPGVSAIGELSTPDPGDLRNQTENSIASTERALRDIGRKLNDQEQKTADQITEFLKEARKALTTGDVDGARTLATKAKVLLSELTR